VNQTVQAVGTGGASRPAAGSGSERQFVAFLLDGRCYAVPLTQVAEITPFVELNQMPHMPKGVEGLLNIRGKVLPVINLRTRMKLAHQEASLSRNIIILDLGGTPTGVLVDVVDSVLTISTDQEVPASQLLAGPEGAWITSFILLGDRIIGLLDTPLVISFGATRVHKEMSLIEDAEVRLDESLRTLINLAPPKTVTDAARIIPQMEEAIAHTEVEMGKVLDRVEAMLTSTDLGFTGLARLKQEVGLGHFKGKEALIASMEKVGQQIQEEVFDLIQKIQFQDVARQKLERVLSHIRGLQVVIGQKFRDTGLHT